MRKFLIMGAGLLGACSVQSSSTSNAANVTTDEVAAANAPAVAGGSGGAGEPTNGTEPAPAPPPTNTAAPAAPAKPEREVVSEAPFTATSAQGAANVVQTYYALIEAKKYAEAHKLWGPSSDLADATFAAPYRQYREYHAEVYAPGRIEGAAGSLYVEVPIKSYGVTNKGERFEEPGTVTLRRVNDVDGSTAEQRRWHIAKIDLPPGPH
ncbi:hypothetical protein M8312_07795 [Sphingomonas sp. KRR8]|uniref:hypothetical protein n=1 Tax=Sphingomonas sp. KRR8 TaxID=2942996 RepID=UPI002020D280|nr:hypothetical protein [Sphingomonas sp. KRR8]URD59728.1 hypothetical protein M8312_07795 [Sphingomonas sp. KRR8]